MKGGMRPTLLLALAGCLLAALLQGTVQVWMDGQGHTYLTDAPEPPAPDARLLSPDELSVQWGGRVVGVPTTDTSSSGPEDRFVRELHAAKQDLEWGELKRGLARLRRLHAAHPSRPEAAWLLAQVERRRGRLVAARDVLRVMLSLPAAEGAWLEAARRELEEVEAELELAEAGSEGFRAEQFASPHFQIHYDHRFAARDYGQRVADLLEEARALARGVLGRVLVEPLDVHLYTKGHYLESYSHRFGFATVGFYDGAIHVVAARHPREHLRALLLHEYVHAVFREAVGSDRPFFLNEGIADREEERLRGRPRLSRGEWRQLVDAQRRGEWIPLESLVRGFGGLEGKRALLAYVESRAVVELIEAHSPGALARWLERCARGAGWRQALEEETGFDVESLDRALRAEAADRFPVDPLAEAALAPNE